MQFELHTMQHFSYRAWSVCLATHAAAFLERRRRFGVQPVAARSPEKEARKVMVMRRRLTTMREWISSAHRHQFIDNTARTRDQGPPAHACAAVRFMRARIFPHRAGEQTPPARIDAIWRNRKASAPARLRPRPVAQPVHSSAAVDAPDGGGRSKRREDRL